MGAPVAGATQEPVGPQPVVLQPLLPPVVQEVAPSKLVKPGFAVQLVQDPPQVEQACTVLEAVPTQPGTTTHQPLLPVAVHAAFTAEHDGTHRDWAVPKLLRTQFSLGPQPTSLHWAQLPPPDGLLLQMNG
jgi:hypothetical protein